jgi:O-antigen/teichoic acid export membrane protein
MFGRRKIAPRISSFITQSAHLTSAQVIITCISLGYFAIVARKLGPELMSVIALYEAAANLIGAVSSFGTIDVALLRSSELFKKGNYNTGFGYFLCALIISTIPYAGLFLIACFAPLGQHNFLATNLGHNWALLILLAAYLYKFSEIGTSCLIAQQRIQILARIRLAGVIAPRIIGIAGLFLLGPKALLKIHLLGYAFTGMFVLIVLAPHFKLIRFSKMMTVWRGCIGSDNLAYFTNSLARTALSQLDVLAVGWMFPQRVLGGYFVCKRAFDLIAQFTEPVLSPCIPMIASGSKSNEAARVIRHATMLVVLISTTGMLGSLLFGNIILLFLGGPKYQSYISVLLAFCLIGWLYWYQSLFLSILYASATAALFSRFSVSCIACSLIISIALGYSFGLAGFVSGRMAASGILICFGAWIILHNDYIPQLEMALIRRGIICIVILFALAYIGRPFLSIRYLLACCIGVAIYIISVKGILSEIIQTVFIVNKNHTSVEPARV